METKWKHIKKETYLRNREDELAIAEAGVVAAVVEEKGGVHEECVPFPVGQALESHIFY